MKQFLKENTALVIGISLPLLLMVLFFVAGNAAQVAVPDPQHDAVFAVEYYNQRNNPSQPWDINIDDGKIVIRTTVDKFDENAYYSEPKLYVFDHKTLHARPVDIDFRNIVDGKVSDPDLDALNQNKFLSNSVSPDGYKFDYHYRSTGGGLAGEIFGFGRHGSSYAVKNGPRAIEITGPEPYYQAHFIGWVTNE